MQRPSAFRLLEQLRLDLLSGTPSMLRSPWRMDVALDPECEDGAGHLFIAMNNQAFEHAVAGSKWSAPAVSPSLRDHRFVSTCPPPRKAVSLNAEGEDDALDWVPRYLQRGIVLWLGVAWPEAMKWTATCRSSCATRRASSSVACPANHGEASLELPGSKKTAVWSGRRS